MMGYSSAFDDLLAEGRRELERIAGQTTPERPTTAPATPARPDGSHRLEGTARGIPFQLTIRPK